MSAPSTSALLSQWNWEPSVVIGLLVLAGVYAYAIGPLRRGRSLGPPASRMQIAWFALSELILVIALLSPIDAIGDQYLFSVHMVQHLLLASLWPVIFLLSLPVWLVRPLIRPNLAGSLLEFLTLPVVALTLFNLDLIAWHLPPLYDLTLQNEWVHVAEHLSFMVFGLFNLWPVLNPIRELRLPYPLQVLYLFVDGMVMMVLGILFTFSPIAFYAPYVAAPRLWSFSAVSDQQLGGLIMWYPGNLPYGVLLIVAFYRWFDGDELVRPERSGIAVQSHTIGPRP